MVICACNFFLDQARRGTRIFSAAPRFIPADRDSTQRNHRCPRSNKRHFLLHNRAAGRGHTFLMAEISGHALTDLSGTPMLISLNLGTPVPLTWHSLLPGTLSLLGFQ